MPRFAGAFCAAFILYDGLIIMPQCINWEFNIPHTYCIYIYTLPAKNTEDFTFQRLFAFLWDVQGVCVLEIHSYEQILLLSELFSNWKQNEAQGFKYSYFGIFFSIRLWLQFLLSLCQTSAISIRLLFRNIVHNTIVYLSSILVQLAGD